jgi:hypothetical protein
VRREIIVAALAVTVSAIALTGAACGGSDDGDEAETPDVTVETDGMITSDLGDIVVNSPPASLSPPSPVTGPP